MNENTLILNLNGLKYEPIGNNSSCRNVANCIHTLQKVEIKDQKIKSFKIFLVNNFPFCTHPLFLFYRLYRNISNW